MTKLFKVVFYLLITLAALGLAVWLVYQNGWQWWFGVAIFFAIIGGLLLAVFIRKLLTKRKMRDFVSRVVEQNNYLANNNVSLNRIQSLNEKWQEASNLIKLSKAQEMPWFLMLGGESSGKSSLIKQSRLSVSLSDNIKKSNEKTENCEWWFLERSIILDTTSRYISVQDETNDNEEWKELLHLFLKFRKRKPINGVVVTISAERLLKSEVSDLIEEGQVIRKRLDNLMRIFWTKFPVYIMITNIDKVFGFNELFQHLSKEELAQPAGYLNDVNCSWMNALDNFFISIKYNLTKLRDRVISSSNNPNKSEILLLPDEFATLRSALYEYVQPIFQNNAYQEQPFCRGIYLSSSLQNEPSKSSILNFDGEFIHGSYDKNNVTKPAFLRGFFDKVLPADKWLLKSAYNGLRLKYLTGSIGVISILSIAFAIGSLMTASYLHNKNTINEFTSKFRTMPLMTSDISTNITNFYELQEAIHKLEKANKYWLVPPFGLTSSKDFTELARQRYVELYRENFLNEFNSLLFNKMQKLDEKVDSQDTSLYISFLTARIDSINDRLDKQASDHNTTSSDERLKNTFPSIMFEIYPHINPIAASLAEPAYISFVAWSDDYEPMRKNMKIMLKTLRDLLIKNPVASVINNQQTFIPYNVTLNDFWGDIDQNHLAIIPGMFTKEGLAQIRKFLLLVKDAGVINGEDDPMLQSFWQWYQTEYYSSWHKFILAFNTINLDSFSIDDRKVMVLSMTTESNPYSKFLSKAAYELSPESHLTNPPDWANLIIDLHDLKRLSSSESTVVSIREKVFQNLGKVVTNTRFKQKSDYINEQINNSAILNDYNTALSQITPDLISDDSYLKYMGDVFSEYNGKSDVKSPVSIAVLKFGQLQRAMTINSHGQNEMIWGLEAGPLNFILDYLFDQTSCAIENKWSSNVIGKISSVRSSDMPRVLLDAHNGLLWQFMNDTLAPFISLDRWGYNSKVLFDKTYFSQALSIDTDFMNFANNNRPSMVDYQGQYAVNISTVPVTVNPEANVKPYGTVLTVQCADGEQTLKNYNYPNQTTVNWSPDKCGDTTLSILFTNFTLTKTYPGSLGFTNFLTDFRAGAHKFTNSDFVESNILTDDYQVHWIQVKYKINSNIPSISMFENFGAKIPQSITNCGASHNEFDSFLQNNGAR